MLMHILSCFDNVLLCVQGRATPGSINDEEPAWAPLRDNYMLTNPKLKDWDKKQVRVCSTFYKSSLFLSLFHLPSFLFIHHTNTSNYLVLFSLLTCDNWLQFRIQDSTTPDDIGRMSEGGSSDDD